MKLRVRFLTIVIVMTVVLLCAVVWIASGFRRFGILESPPVVYPPEDCQPWVAGVLQKRFNWAKLPPSSVEGVWVEGFQDHMYLSRTRLTPELFADLKRSVLATQGESVSIDDRDDLSLSPEVLPAGPSPEYQIPSWWEARSMKHFDSIRWRTQDLEYWFGYDIDRQLLFFLVCNT